MVWVSFNAFLRTELASSLFCFSYSEVFLWVMDSAHTITVPLHIEYILKFFASLKKRPVIYQVQSYFCWTNACKLCVQNWLHAVHISVRQSLFYRFHDSKFIWKIRILYQCSYSILNLIEQMVVWTDIWIFLNTNAGWLQTSCLFIHFLPHLRYILSLLHYATSQSSYLHMFPWLSQDCHFSVTEDSTS